MTIKTLIILGVIASGFFFIGGSLPKPTPEPYQDLLAEPTPEQVAAIPSNAPGVVIVRLNADECVTIVGYYSIHEPLTDDKPSHKMTIARGPRDVAIWPYTPASYAIERRPASRCLK